MTLIILTSTAGVVPRKLCNSDQSLEGRTLRPVFSVSGGVGRASIVTSLGSIFNWASFFRECSKIGALGDSFVLSNCDEAPWFLL